MVWVRQIGNFNMIYRCAANVAKFIFGSIMVCFASSAWAVDYMGSRGGWDVFKSDERCYMIMDYEGPGATNFMFMKSIDGDIFVQVSNSEWSSKEGSKYEITYNLNGTSYGGGISLGTKVDYRSGFMTSFEKDFETAFAAGSSLHIYLGDTRIDQLSLDGTTIGLNLLNACLTKLKAEHAAVEKEKRRWEHLPKDPFQNSPEAASGPIPRGSGLTWANASDYPSSALKEEREGRTGYRLTVNAMGMVTDCLVTETSGHVDLDEATCKNISRRARFRPAIGEDGQPKSGVWESSITWAIPK